MKRYKEILAVALGLMLAGCDSEVAKETPVSPDGVVATVTGEISETATRASGADISEGVFPDKSDRVAEIVVCPKGTPPTGMKSKYRYVHESNGLFKAKDSDNEIRFYDDKPVEFYAYYPWILDHETFKATYPTAGNFTPEYNDNNVVCGHPISDMMAGASIMKDVPYFNFVAYGTNGVGGFCYSPCTQSNEYRNKYGDLLVAQGAVASASNPTIRFNENSRFRHVMSKVNVSLNTGGQFTDGGGYFIAKAAMSGIYLNGYFDPATCSFTALNKVTNWYVLYNNSIGGENLDLVYSGAWPYENIKAMAYQFRGKLEDGLVSSGDVMVIPQTASELKFSFTFCKDNVEEVFVTEPLTNFEFESGKVYTFNLAVSGSQLILSGITIKDWETAPGAVVNIKR